MVQNNKVLTVSYGTFSCTLEGFDDSFGTMKAIAEYFRDLAADDRYFGAEPPQPDADMLARIAQREIARQVEAHHDSKGIVLRAADHAPLVAGAAAAAPELNAPTEAPVEDLGTDEPDVRDEAPAIAEPDAQTAETAGPVDEVPVVDEATVAEPESETAVDEAPVSEPEAESAVDEAPVEEPEAEIDAVEEMPVELVIEDPQPEPEAVAAQADQDETETEEVVVAESDEQLAPDLDVAEAEPEDAPEVDLIDEGETVAAAERADALEAEAEIVDEIDEDEPEAELIAEPEYGPASDSIAAKLERIRAVVSRNDDEGEDSFTEDEHAMDTANEASPVDLSAIMDNEYEDEPSDIVADAAADIAAAFEADDEIDFEFVDSLGADVSEDSVSEPEAKVELDAVAEAETGDHDAVEADEEDADALFSDLDDEAFEEEAEDDVSADDLNNILGSEDDGSEQNDVPVRVLKVDRAEFEAATDSTEGALSDEDEADLLAELAAVEAELKAGADDDEDDLEATADADEMPHDETIDPDPVMQDEHVQPDDHVAMQGEGSHHEDAEAAVTDNDDHEGDEDERGTLPPLADENGEDLSRLMARADEKLDDPDLSSNRDAYSHLRAAVAAAEAERSAGGTVGTRATIEDDDYREDLASVVRPRRPTVASSTSRPRSAGERPAPLKLVAEQRVDLAGGEDAGGPVRPRRIGADLAEDTTQTADGGFAAFAAEKGAVALPDLLEAAAAYMSFVEGRDQFSRPQLMNKVRQLENQDFNREDGLRSFGQLLRDGKIEKTGGGRFTASGDIGFQPDERAAG
ncbi:MAG: chemotaxis protein CheA [Pseudomonadota bacterium]